MGLTFNGKTPESITIGGKAVASLSINGDVVWPEQPAGPNYFYIENLYNGSNTIKLNKNGTPSAYVQYSFDKSTWTTCTYSSNVCSIPVSNLGDRVYFRSNGFSNHYSSSNYYNFAPTRDFKIGGDIRSLLSTSFSEIDTALSRCFYRMFYNATKLLRADDLDLSHITTLAASCYCYMFYGCTSLIAAPELPATTLATNCYMYMFQNCSSLITAPTSLPATTLASNCYHDMFYGCTSLIAAPEIYGLTIIDYCFEYMFQNCSSLNKVITHATSWNTTYTAYWLAGVSSTGDFYNLGGATIPTGSSGIPQGWTVHTS